MNKLWCNDYTYTPIIKWCLEDILKMDDYSLTVNCCVFLDRIGGEFIPPDNIHISQDLVHPANLRAIFHEVRHYYQFKKGIYDFIPGPYHRPLPEEMPEHEKKLQRYFDYLEYPWELDATQFSMETVSKFLKTPMGKTHIPYPN